MNVAVKPEQKCTEHLSEEPGKQTIAGKLCKKTVPLKHSSVNLHPSILFCYALVWTEGRQSLQLHWCEWKVSSEKLSDAGLRLRDRASWQQGSRIMHPSTLQPRQKGTSPRSRGPKEGVAYNFCFISHSVLPVEDCWMKGGTPGSWKVQAEHRCGSWGHHCKVLRERKLPPWILWKHPYGMKRKERWSRMKKNRNFWQQPFAGRVKEVLKMEGKQYNILQHPGWRKIHQKGKPERCNCPSPSGFRTSSR